MPDATPARQEKLYRPLLQMALLCERVLTERDGVISIIRVIDRFVVSGPSIEMPPTMIRFTLVVGFKSGFMRGKQKVRLVPIKPNGEQLNEFAFPVLFEGEDRGAAFVGEVNFVVPEEGLYWFEVAIEEDVFTRIPLRVLYQQVGIGQPGRG